MKMDKNTAGVLLALITTIGGGAEMRFAVARLEDKVNDLQREVSELQRELRPSVALAEP